MLNTNWKNFLESIGPRTRNGSRIKAARRKHVNNRLNNISCEVLESRQLLSAVNPLVEDGIDPNVENENNSVRDDALESQSISQEAVRAQSFSGSGIPQLTGPSGSINDSTPTITWQGSQGATDYVLYLYNEGTGQSVVDGLVLSGTSFTLNQNLPDGNYIAYVAAFDGNQWSDYGSMQFQIAGETGVDPGHGGQVDAYRTLYLNFDGVSLSPQDLQRYANNQWESGPQGMDSQGDGVQVAVFQGNTFNRQQYIDEIMRLVSDGVAPFGITLQRLAGGSGAVEGWGATTIFVGENNDSPPDAGVASSIDQNNDNATDMAYVDDMPIGNNPDWFIKTVADNILHKAGHTWGLFHVNTNQQGTIYPDTMGFGYTVGFYNATLNEFPITGFMNQTFVELIDNKGGHGVVPGVTEQQNSFRYLAGIFGSTNRSNAIVNQEQVANDYALYSTDVRFDSSDSFSDEIESESQRKSITRADENSVLKRQLNAFSSIASAELNGSEDDTFDFAGSNNSVDSFFEELTNDGELSSSLLDNLV